MLTLPVVGAKIEASLSVFSAISSATFDFFLGHSYIILLFIF